MNTTPASDYPAAHSMDTTWYAVDREGNLGVFEAGQDAVVPWTVPRSTQVFELAYGPEGGELLTFDDDFDELSHTFWADCYLYRQCLWAMPEQVLLNASLEDPEIHQSGLDYYRQELENIKWQARFNPSDEPQDVPTQDHQLMFLPSAELAESHVARGLAHVKQISDVSSRVPASAPKRIREWLSDPRWRSAVAVYFLSVDLADWLRFHEAGCLDCMDFEGWDYYNASLRVGAYFYSGNRADGVYNPTNWPNRREPPEQHAPAHALNVDQLPQSVRRLVEVARFDDISFRSAEPITVHNYGPCYGYGGPICFEYNPATNDLCCTVPESLADEPTKQMFRRGREEASRWGFSFEDPKSAASREAQRRVLRLMLHHAQRNEQFNGPEVTTYWLNRAQQWEEAIGDHPAAHSMDTEWFAVDADGHVASFWSGENGPVPKAYFDWEPVREVFTNEGEADFFQENRGNSFAASDYLLKQLNAARISSDIVVDLQGAFHVLNDRWYGANRIEHGRYERPVREIRRKRLGRALLVVRPDRRRPNPQTGVASPNRWSDRLIVQVEDYREANPTDIIPDLVRVALEFPTEDLALDVYAALAQEPSLGRQTLRGRCLVCHDVGEDRVHGAVHDHTPGPVYAWLDERIQSGRFPEPRVLLGRPQLRPSGEQLHRLWDELTELRGRCAAIVEGHVPTRRRRRELEVGPQRDVWETLIALLLHCAGRDFDALPDYYCYFDADEFVPVMPMARLGQLAPLLTEATLDDWRLLERLAEFLPLTEPLQRLRLQTLSILAEEGNMPIGELRASMRRIFQGRDEDLHDLLPVLQWAFKLPGLPVAELRQTIRREITAVPDDLGELFDDAGLQALLHRLDEGDYPAAHSTDSCWFAVDAEGHVAYADTGETGTLPTMPEGGRPIRDVLSEHGHPNVLSAWGDSWAYDLAQFVFQQLRQMEIPEQSIIDVPVCLHPYNDGHFGWDCIPDVAKIAHIRWRTLGPVLALVASRQAVIEELDRGEGILVPQISEGPVAVLFTNMPASTAKRLILARQLLGIMDPSSHEHLTIDDRLPAQHTRPGIFCYSFRDYSSGSYYREALPSVPVRLADLPPVVQAIVGRIRLENVRFREARFLEPAKHVPCLNLPSWPENLREDGSLDAGANLDRINQERNESLDEMDEFPDYDGFDPWALQLIERIESFRQTNAPHEALRAWLDFGSTAVAASVQQASEEEMPRLLGHKWHGYRLSSQEEGRLLVKDWGVVDTHVANVDDLYDWIAQQLRTERFPEPRLELSATE